MTIDCLGRDNDVYGLACKDPSLTVQSDAVDADINTIVKRFGITGELPQNLPFVTNLDLSEAPDTYQGAIEVLQQAQDAFMALPADVRSQFGNDPGRFMDFVSEADDEGRPVNIKRMRELGLAVAPAEDAPKPIPSPVPAPAPVV